MFVKCCCKSSSFECPIAYIIVCCGSLIVACFVQITTVDEAKTFYPLFGLGANVALIFSGRAVKYFSQVRSQSLCTIDLFGYL